MTRLFQRTVEDFDCGHCGSHVQGDGYTNHCPVCLWSQHVDVNPGDRAAACKGLMRPLGLEHKRGLVILIHRCELCGFLRRNRSSDADDFAAILALSTAQL